MNSDLQINYNSDLQINYDNDDDYRVCMLNAYNVVLELEGDNLNDALTIMFSRQQELFNEINKNNIIKNMLDEIVSNDNRGHWITSSPDYLFFYLHGYEFFNDFHKIICACINKEDSVEELCIILKNKILTFEINQDNIGKNKIMNNIL